MILNNKCAEISPLGKLSFSRPMAFQALLLLGCLSLFSLLLSCVFALLTPDRSLLGNLIGSALYSTLTFGIIPIIVAINLNEKKERRLFLGIKSPLRLSFKKYLIAIGATLGMLVLIALVNHGTLYLIERLEGSVGDFLRELQSSANTHLASLMTPCSPSIAAFRIFVVAILAGFVEELFMRGTLQPIFIRLTNNVHWGIFLTAGTFSLLHFSPILFFPIFLYGLLFGYWRHYTGSIFPGVALHIINNLLTLLMY